jgi:hypothetical protein
MSYINFVQLFTGDIIIHRREVDLGIIGLLFRVIGGFLLDIPLSTINRVILVHLTPFGVILPT